MILRTTDSVRRVLGERNAQAVLAGVGLPGSVQCWGCGGYEDTAQDLVMILSAVDAGAGVAVGAFSHRGCGGPRVFTAQEFEQATAALAQPQPVRELEMRASGYKTESAVIVDGERLL